MAAIFKVQKSPTIEINGHEFKLRLSEATMLERAQQLQEMSEDLQKQEKQSVPELLKACKAVEAYINDLCGEGAMDTMVDGAVMSVMETIRLLGVVNMEAGAAFGKALAEKHG